MTVPSTVGVADGATVDLTATSSTISSNISSAISSTISSTISSATSSTTSSTTSSATSSTTASTTASDTSTVAKAVGGTVGPTGMTTVPTMGAPSRGPGGASDRVCWGNAQESGPASACWRAVRQSWSRERGKQRRKSSWKRAMRDASMGSMVAFLSEKGSMLRPCSIIS